MAAAFAASCGGSAGDTGPAQTAGCQVVALQVSPTTAAVVVGDTITLIAQYQTSTICGTHPTITWSASSSAVSLQPDGAGEVVFVTGRGASAQPVTVTAKAGSLTSAAQVTVTTGPSIKLTPDTIRFTAAHSGPAPPIQVVALTNGGGGVLSQVGPGATVYGPGASGWLFIQKSGLTSTAPYNLNLQPTNTTFPAGTYTATVPVTSPVASNSPQNLTVLLTITGATAPTISNLAMTLVSVNSCTSSGVTGNTFKVTFSFSDPAGDAFTGSVLESFAFQPSGGSGNLSFTVPSSSVTVANGTMSLGSCVVFGASNSITLTVAIQSSVSGGTSNSLTINVTKPPGGGATGPSLTPLR